MLLPQVPFDPVTMKPLPASPQRQRRRGAAAAAGDVAPPLASTTPSSPEPVGSENDRASDKSEGDSGKENDEDYHPATSGPAKRAAAPSGTKSKLTEKKALEPSRGNETKMSYY